MIKVYCGECGVELSEEEINYCAEMIGYKYVCLTHRQKQDHSGFKYVVTWNKKRPKYEKIHGVKLNE